MNDLKKFYNEVFHVKRAHALLKIMYTFRYKFLRRTIRDYSGRLLVVGCGSRDEMSIVGERYTEVIGIDISQKAISGTQKLYPQFSYRVMDACSLDFQENSFDVVVCSEVMEHLSDEDAFLSGVRKILRPDGVLILTVPNWWSFYGLARLIAEKITGEQVSADDQPIDNWVNPYMLQKKIRCCGFIVKKKYGLWFLPPFGRGRFQVPALVTIPIFILFYPLEKFFSVVFPFLGHMVAFTLVNKKSMC